MAGPLARRRAAVPTSLTAGLIALLVSGCSVPGTEVRSGAGLAPAAPAASPAPAFQSY